MSKTFRAWKIEDPLLLPVSVRDFVAVDCERWAPVSRAPLQHGAKKVAGQDLGNVQFIPHDAQHEGREMLLVTAAVMRQPRWAEWPIEG